jgi:hypothetical protein
MPPGGSRGSAAVLLVKPEDVLEAPDCLDPDAVLDPDAPVVARALPSVDEPSVSESVELGASVIVPLAESGTVEDGRSDSDESGDADVLEGVSKNIAIQFMSIMTNI